MLRYARRQRADDAAERLRLWQLGFFEESSRQLLGFVRCESVADRRQAIRQKPLHQLVQAVGGVRWGPALTGHGRGHGFEDCAGWIAEGQDEVKCRGVATSESQAHFETAEAALGICLSSEDNHNRSVEDAIEQALRELVAVFDLGGVEEGQTAKSRRQSLGVGDARPARIRDEDRVRRVGECRRY